MAILGAPPAFDSPVHVGGPNLPDRDRLHHLLDGILDRGWLTNNGPLVQEFERQLRQHLGVKHCIALCNATVGLELAARALKLTGEVIVPAFTFVATAHALKWLGLDPVFCDVDYATHNLDPKRLEQLITPRTSAVLGVHLWGRPCDIEALEAICAGYGLHLFFDAAHAFGCTYKGRPIGAFGRLEVFSFHATKFLNTFEGGAIATNSDALAREIRLLLNFGFAGYDTVVSLGVNGKMSEMAAAMGLASLERVDAAIETNHAHHARYAAAFEAVAGVQLLNYDTMERHNYQYVVLDIDSDAAGLSRDELVAVLWAEQVHARRYFSPGCHRMSPYAADERWRLAPLPMTERLADRLLTLPTGTSVRAEDIDAIAAIIRTALGAPEPVRRALAAARASV